MEMEGEEKRVAGGVGDCKSGDGEPALGFSLQQENHAKHVYFPFLFGKEKTSVRPPARTLPPPSINHPRPLVFPTQLQSLEES